jgi:hypothetical protein
MQSSSLAIRGIKMLDIAYISGIYIAIALTYSVFLNNYIGKFEPKVADKKSITRLVLEIWLQLSLITMSAYVIHNIVELAPSPLDRIAGFNHALVKERSGGVIFGFLLFFYQTNLRDKISYVIHRLGY